MGMQAHTHLVPRTPAYAQAGGEGETARGAYGRWAWVDWSTPTPPVRTPAPARGRGRWGRWTTWLTVLAEASVVYGGAGAPSNRYRVLV